MSGKNCWPGPTGLLSLPHRTPQHLRFFEGEKMIFKPSNMLLASFFASNFLDENKSRQQREFVFGSSISPPENRESFHIKKCTATFLCYLLGLLWQATDTKPQEIQVQQRSGIRFSLCGIDILCSVECRAL